MSKLLALGAGSARYPGEALIWAPSVTPWGVSSRVAIDVGKTPDMGRAVALSSPAVLVLTHDDHDHIGGWTGFAELGLDTLREIWLPYEWGGLLRVLSNTVPGIPDEASAALEGVLSVVRSREQEGQNSPEGDLENGADDAEWATAAARRGTELREDDTFVERLGELLSETRKSLEDASPSAPADDTWIGTPREIARRALDRAGRIGRIVEVCTQEDVKVRWFSVDHDPGCFFRMRRSPSGSRWRNVVSIANADEVLFVRSGVPSSGPGLLARFLALTVQNRRALCPVLWEHGRWAPRVLVWSDSSGEWAERHGVRGLFGVIDASTAPHHGSTVGAHAPAWTALQPFLARQDTVMLLAGGEPTQTGVRQEYTDLAPDRRCCTRCRHSPGIRSKVQSVAIRFSVDGARVAVGACGA